MYLFLVVFMLCVFFYTIKKGNSKVNGIYWQYPTCFYEIPFIGNLYKFLSSKEHFINILHEIWKKTSKLGGVSRIQGLNSHYLDVADVLEILKYYLDKDYTAYSILQAITGNGSVFNIDSSVAKVRRQLLLPALSSNLLSTYIDDICEESNWLTKKLEQHAGNGPFCTDYFTTFCLQCVLKMAKVLEFKKEIKDTEEIVEEYRTIFQLVSDRLFSFWLHSDFLYGLTSDFRKLKNIVSGFYRYAEKVQDIRKQQLETQKTRDYGLFDGFIASDLNKREISEEIIVTLGSSEEPGLTIGYILTLLSQFPSVQKKVYEELTEIFGDSDRPLVREDLLKMRYLDMVMKESLRLYPPGPLIFRKAHKEMKLSSGRVVPAGVSIAVAIVCIQRDPQYWGADATHFDPERFSPERLQGVPNNAFLPFSYGARGCPGYKLGIYMVKAAVSSILRKYKIVEKPASGPVPNIETKFEVSLKPVKHFEIEIIKRV